jgi:hypothetical protein
VEFEVSEFQPLSHDVFSWSALTSSEKLTILSKGTTTLRQTTAPSPARRPPIVIPTIGTRWLRDAGRPLLRDQSYMPFIDGLRKKL